MDLVSIIIPVYNRANLISETLHSIQKQTYTYWECIIIDDGSSDNTMEVVQTICDSDHRFKLLKRPDDYRVGGNGARNYGFKQAQGKYIQWFDSDDIMLPTFIERKLQLFTSNTELVICSGYSVDAELQNPREKIVPNTIVLFRDYVLWKSEIMLPSPMFKKSFLGSKQLFDEVLSRGQENDFFSRVFFNLQKNQFKTIQEPLYYYRQHLATKTKEDKLEYVGKYKESLGLVSIRNLKRGLFLKDCEIIDFHYKYANQCIFMAMHNNDKQTVLILTKHMTKTIQVSHMIFAKFYYFSIRLMLLLNRPIYRIEKFLKKKTLC